MKDRSSGLLEGKFPRCNGEIRLSTWKLFKNKKAREGSSACTAGRGSDEYPLNLPVTDDKNLWIYVRDDRKFGVASGIKNRDRHSSRAHEPRLAPTAQTLQT